jgi:formamidopyrimidine-DNA glycosylase
LPELPEMENYKLLLNQKLSGKWITSIIINREKSLNVPATLFISQVTGHQLIKVERRAKHLLFHLENGLVLLLHLMLGGWMFLGKEDEKPKRTIQVQLSFGEEHLYFIGLRLGYLHLYTSKVELENVLSDLGPEPNDSKFTVQEFMELIDGRKGRLKTKLVDQQFIAGIGNCYSDEICFDCGILPMRAINEMTLDEKSKLYQSIQFVLQDATKHGGYMENPLFPGDVLTGGYNNLCKVYDREGESCVRCGGPIKKEIISSRKTFYCANCQT